MGKIFLMSERSERIRKIPIQAEATPKLRIVMCEASVASIHKLAMSPRVFVRTHKKYFVMRATPEFNLALGIYVKNALKIVFLLHPEKSQSKKEPKRSLFKGVFVGLSVISEEIKIIKSY